MDVMESYQCFWKSAIEIVVDIDTVHALRYSQYVVLEYPGTVVEPSTAPFHPSVYRIEMTMMFGSSIDNTPTIHRFDIDIDSLVKRL